MPPIAPVRPESFPALLREIADPPELLYLCGTLPSDENKFLAVVGSRKYSSYGRDACETLIAKLAGYPIVIVSGLALGIDAIAHESALQAGLSTIAVPGSGLNEDVLYPATHSGLARRIVEEGGALLSEFAPDFRATQWSFPQRNRIMAGLSHAVLVVEAAHPSGTLITARLALEYNRDVFAVPGNIFMPGSEGANRLLREGAAPITKSEDIIRALGLPLREDAGQKNGGNHSPEEERVLALLHEPRERDELVETLGMRASEVNILLSGMEIKGLIRERGGFVERT